MKIVLVAPNVSENVSGEAIKAFQYAKNLAEAGDDVSLITHERSAGHLAHFPKAVTIVFVKDDFWHLLVWRSIVLRPLIDIPFFLAARKLVEEMRAPAPDTVFHYIGPVSPIVPRFPPRGARCILGPVTGNIYYPPGLRRREPFSLRWRRLLHGVGQRLVGAVFNDKARFRAILVSGGARTRASLIWSGARDDQMCDVVDAGISEAILKRPKIEHADENFRFVMNGRMMPHKGVDLAIRAIARTSGPATLDIFGRGPEEARLRGLVRELRLEARVSFQGWLSSHEALLDRMRNYRAFVFPSMAEANGIVVEEALAMGLPVICLDWGGPAALTRKETALRIAPLSEDQIIGEIARHMDRLTRDPAFAQRLADAGVDEARRIFSWKSVSEDWRRAYSAAER